MNNNNINKNLYGKNKNERFINKTKAYFGLTLNKCSNKYYELKEQEISDNLFIIAPSSCEQLKTKYGHKLLVTPNNTDKELWINHYLTLPAFNGVGEIIAWIVKPNEEQKGLLNELSKNADDVDLLKNADLDRLSFTIYNWD